MLFQYEPELDAFLEFLIWRFSIWVDKPTPGNGLMNLRYRDERTMELRGKGKNVCTHFFVLLFYEYSPWSYVIEIIINLNLELCDRTDN